MIDLKLLEHLESYLTESRKKRFDTVLPERTKHFTVATEDVYQLHNTSAVIRSCDVFGIQEVNIVEEVNSKSIFQKIVLGANPALAIINSTKTVPTYSSTRRALQVVRRVF